MRNTIRKIKNISLRIRAMKQYMEGLNHHVSYEEALVDFILDDNAATKLRQSGEMGKR